MKLLFALVLLFQLHANAYPRNPNPEWTPGSVCNPTNPDFSGHRYPEKIPYCQRNVSSELKQELYDLYKIPEKCRERYTIDHLIPLSIGGDNTADNLWPEHRLVKATRPDLELEVYEAVKIGKLSQKRAIRIILDEKMSHKEFLKASFIKSDCDEGVLQ